MGISTNEFTVIMLALHIRWRGTDFDDSLFPVNVNVGTLAAICSLKGFSCLLHGVIALTLQLSSRLFDINGRAIDVQLDVLQQL